MFVPTSHGNKVSEKSHYEPYLFFQPISLYVGIGMSYFLSLVMPSWPFQTAVHKSLGVCCGYCWCCCCLFSKMNSLKTGKQRCFHFWRSHFHVTRKMGSEGLWMDFLTANQDFTLLFKSSRKNVWNHQIVAH